MAMTDSCPVTEEPEEQFDVTKLTLEERLDRIHRRLDGVQVDYTKPVGLMEFQVILAVLGIRNYARLESWRMEIEEVEKFINNHGL